jgi:hypothetical protein
VLLGSISQPFERPLWVIRVILTVRRSLPVYPDKQTISEPVGTSHLCQFQTFSRFRRGQETL